MAESQEERTSNENLVRWAASQGVVCDGVMPKSLPGRGRGMVAMRKLNEGEQIIHAPADTLLAVDSDPTFLVNHAHQIRNCSLHGQIAANLTYALVKVDHALASWTAVVPTIQEVKDCMPVFWPRKLQQYLPESSCDILQKQQKKLFSDLDTAAEEYLTSIATEVQMNVEDLRDVYMQAWMLVNSRCFYWDFEYPMPSLRDGHMWPVNWKRPKARQRTRGRQRDDCMALCPVIDCFNHTVEESCTVTYDERGFFVTCVHDCEAGEELYITYGSHSNDYLLVEYGFMLDPNSNDHTTLDHLLLPRLSTAQQDYLRDENLLGSYVLDSAGVCHRTQCALRILLLPLQKWQRYVKGLDDGLKEQDQVDELLRAILNEYRTESERKTREVLEANLPDDNGGVDIEGAKSLILKRWKHLGEMLDTNIK